MARRGKLSLWSKLELVKVKRWTVSSHIRLEDVKASNRKVVCNSHHYLAAHEWRRANMRAAIRCEFCKNKDKKRYEWANISREYKKEVSDWIQLCTQCHKQYDLGKLNSEMIKYLKIKT